MLRSTFLVIGFVGATVATTTPATALTLTSPAFSDGGVVPVEYTCQGDDVSPPLEWSGIPDGTKSLAVIVDDPDAPDPKAPKRIWLHWVVYNLPPSTTGLPRAVSAEALPAGAKLGTNDWKRDRYNGPCPPIGRHRYFWKVYALSKMLPDLGAANEKEILGAMKDSVLAQAELEGTYGSDDD